MQNSRKIDRIQFVNQWYYWGCDDASPVNDTADQIINSPDRFLLSQAKLQEAQGGYATIALSLGLVTMGTLSIFAGAPRTASHFRNGQCSAMEWGCLLSSGLFWYFTGNQIGQRAFGDAAQVRAHWMAYTFVKSQNRFEGRRILGKIPTY